VGYIVIVRDRGRRESLLYLMAAVVLGFLPVAACLTGPKTGVGSRVFGIAVGLPFFVLSLVRLRTLDALALSADSRTLALFRRSSRGRTRIDLAVSEIKGLGLGGYELGITMRSGERLELEVDNPRTADPSLRGFAKRFGIPYTSGPGVDGP
jgi:hypothetical protein